MLKRLSLIFIILCTLTNLLQAQELDPDQPEQDACNAILLCGTTFNTPYSYVGEGVVSDITSSPCGVGSGEGNSVWFQLNVATSGTIEFSIIPEDEEDDYDFLVIDMTETTCDDLSSSDVVRCNFNNNSPGSNVDGIVGVSSAGTSDYTTSGAFGGSFVNEIDAVAGETYLIMINNWGHYSGGGVSAGFTLDFDGSTATFNTDGPPSYDSIETKCDLSESLTLHITQQLQCSSIDGDGSGFYLTPSGTISSVSGLGCSDDDEGYTQILEFTFSPALEPGTYTLHPQAGGDGNSVLDLCAEELAYAEEISFTIPERPEIIESALLCRRLTLTTNKPIKCSSVAIDGSDYSITGPGPVTILSAEAFACTPTGYTNTIRLTLQNPMSATGTYSVIAQTGSDGNTILDSCDFAQAIGNSFEFDINTLSPALSLPDSVTTCIGDSIQLPLEVTNIYEDVTYSYIWTPATGLSSTAVPQPYASPSVEQSYRIEVFTSDPATCTSVDSITVRVLQGFDIMNNDTVVCDGAVFVLNVAGSNEYSYSWAPEDGLSDPTVKSPTLTATTSNIYSVTASYPGCSDSTQYIAVDVQPYPHIDRGEFQRYMCYGDSTLLEATITPSGMPYDYTYSWTPDDHISPLGQPNTIYFGDTSTMIYLTVSSPAGCSATDSVKIDVYPPVLVGLNLADTGVCSGGSVQLSATGGVSYQWTPADGLSDPNIAAPVASPTASTLYQVLVTDENGCSATGEVMVQVYPDAVINLSDSVNIYPGESYEMDMQSNALYFSWFPPSGLSANNIANPIAQPEVRTRYFVTATTEHGCSASDSIDVLVKGTTLDMPNAFVPGSDNNGTFKVAKRGIATLNSFRIFDRWGIKVFETVNIDEGWDGTMNGQPQPMGVYIYTVEATTDSGRPFVKQGNVTLIR